MKSSVETAINDNQYFIGVYKEIIENGVSKVKTSNNFTFDKDGLHIGSDSSKTKNVIDTKAMTIYKNDNEELLFAGYEDTINQSIVKVDNITVKNYFVIPGVRVEKYDNSDIGKTGTGFFNLKVGDK